MLRGYGSCSVGSFGNTGTYRIGKKYSIFRFRTQLRFKLVGLMAIWIGNVRFEKNEI